MQKRATNGQKLEVQKVCNKFKKSTIEKAKKAKWNLFPGQVKNGISNFIYTYGPEYLTYILTFWTHFWLIFRENLRC